MEETLAPPPAKRLCCYTTSASYPTPNTFRLRQYVEMTGLRCFPSLTYLAGMAVVQYHSVWTPPQKHIDQYGHNRSLLMWDLSGLCQDPLWTLIGWLCADWVNMLIEPNGLYVCTSVERGLACAAVVGEQGSIRRKTVCAGVLWRVMKHTAEGLDIVFSKCYRDSMAATTLIDTTWGRKRRLEKSNCGDGGGGGDDDDDDDFDLVGGGGSGFGLDHKTSMACSMPTIATHIQCLTHNIRLQKKWWAPCVRPIPDGGSPFSSDILRLVISNRPVQTSAGDVAKWLGSCCCIDSPRRDRKLFIVNGTYWLWMRGMIRLHLQQSCIGKRLTSLSYCDTGEPEVTDGAENMRNALYKALRGSMPTQCVSVHIIDAGVGPKDDRLACKHYCRSQWLANLRGFLPEIFDDLMQAAHQHHPECPRVVAGEKDVVAIRNWICFRERPQ